VTGLPNPARWAIRSTVSSVVSNSTQAWSRRCSSSHGIFGDTDITLDSRAAVDAARALGDALIIPIHAEGWWHFSETLDRLVQSFAYANLSHRLRVLTAGVDTVL
jgi:hypothetical protein